jgi:hypothetical protein
MVKLSLCLIRTTLLTSALHGVEWSASHSSHLTPEKSSCSTHWTRDRVTPQSVKQSVPHQEHCATTRTYSEVCVYMLCEAQ